MGAVLLRGDFKEFAAGMGPATGKLDGRASALGPDLTVIPRVAIHWPAMVCLQTMKRDLQDAGEALQNVIGILPAAPRRIGEGHAGRGRATPWSIIAGQGPEVSGFGLTRLWIEHRGAGLVCYPAGDCTAIGREGMNSLLDRFRSAISAVNTGFNS